MMRKGFPAPYAGLFMVALLAALCFTAQAAQAAENVYDTVNRAVKAQSDGNAGLAFELYSEIIHSGKLETDPKILAYIYNNRAVLWLQQGSQSMALDDFQNALVLHPDHTTYYNRALIFSQQARPRDALADLDKAIEMFPRYARAYTLRGQLHLELGNRDQAREDLRLADFYKYKISFLKEGQFEAPKHGAFGETGEMGEMGEMGGVGGQGQGQKSPESATGLTRERRRVE